MLLSYRKPKKPKMLYILQLHKVMTHYFSIDTFTGCQLPDTESCLLHLTDRKEHGEQMIQTTQDGSLLRIYADGRNLVTDTTV